MLLGGFAWKMSADDRKKIDTGRLDPEGQRSAEMGQALGICSVILSLLASIYLVGGVMMEYVVK